MSLTNSTEYSMQAEDKNFGLLHQPLDDSFNDMFNQYVNMDRPTGDSNKETSAAPSLDVLFVQGTPSSGPGYPPITDSANVNNQTPQPWRKGLWCLQDTALSATERHAHLNETVQPSAVSGSGFDINASSQPQEHNGLLTPSISTPSSTPNRQTAKGVGVTPKIIYHREPNDRRNLLRKYNSSPTLMRTTNLGNNEMTYQALRTPKSQNFALQHPSPFPSMQSETQVGYGDMSRMTSRHGTPYDSEVGDSAEFPVARFETSMLHQPQAVSSSSQPTNFIGHHDQFDNNAGALVDHSHFNTGDLFHTPCTTEQQPFCSDQQSFSSWNSDFTSNTPTIPYAPETQTQGTQSWWPSIPTTFSQPYSTSYEPMIMAPTPQRLNTGLVNSTNLVEGDITTMQNSATDLYSSAEQFFPGQVLSPIDVGVGTPYSCGTPYSSLSTSQHPSLDYLLSSSSQNHASPPPSRSDSISPKAIAPPKRSSTVNTATPGPNTRASNAKDHRRAHNRKPSTAGNASRTPRASASSKSLRGRSSNGALNVSFVNFTPDDSRKILTGVAPSGSSKTKARREQEAREKRRKLSEAALTAIRQAGGDINDLSVFY